MESARHISLLSLFYFTMVILSSCAAATWHVDGSVASSGDGTSWEQAFKTIQQGVDAGAGGDTVIVAPGTYTENVLIRGKEITLQSTNPSEPQVVAGTVVQGTKPAQSAISIDEVEEGQVGLDGLTVTGGNNSGVRCYSSARISRCIITGNAGWSRGGGISCDYASVVIIGCQITNNTTGGSGGGVYCGSGSATIANCLISGNYAWEGGGVHCCSDCLVVVRNSIISGNTATFGAAIFSGSHSVEVTNATVAGNAGAAIRGPMTLRNCIIWDDPRGLGEATASYCCIKGFHPGEGNFSYCPHFVDPEDGDFHLQSWSPCIDSGDPDSSFSFEPEPNGGRVNMGVYGDTPEAATKCADTDADGLPDDWETHCFSNLTQEALGDEEADGIPNLDEYHYGWDPATPAPQRAFNPSSGRYFEEIQPAIADANHGDEIVLSPGVYRGGVCFSGRAITVRSTEPTNPAIIAGTIISVPDDSAVVFESGEGQDSTLAGVTVESGGPFAIYCSQSSPVVRNNRITSLMGRGIFCEYGTPEIRENTITGCLVPIECYESSATVASNRIVYNDGSVLCRGGYPSIVGNYIARNRAQFELFWDAGAIVFTSGGCHSPQGFAWIVGNTIVDNEGKGIWSRQPCVIERNVILRNSLGGVLCRRAPDTIWIIGNLIAENTCSPNAVSVEWKAVLVNNTVVNNRRRTSSKGDLAYTEPSVGIEAQREAAIANCITWGHDTDVSGCTASFSCFREAGDGCNSIAEDPMFVNPAVGDYHLLTTSPCIRAGCPRGDMPDTDIDGEPVPLTARPDIGADQFTDSDGDLMPDYWEIAELGGIEADPQEDADDDGLSNLDELLNRARPNNKDSDGDGLPDPDEVHLYSTHPCKKDTDDDGVEDNEEIFDFGSNPNSPDTDGDGLPDGWEVEWQFSPTIALGDDGPEGDPDGDGLANLDELKWHTNPRDSDTDDDGLPDGWERKYSLSPTYREGIHGGDADPDNDGLSNLEEFLLGTNPRSYDTDSDGMPDGWEVQWGLNPTVATGNDGPDADVDSDKLTNIAEYENGTDPHNADTDNDGMCDGEEILAGTAPLDPNSFFRIIAVQPDQEGNSLFITWRSVPDRVYRLHYSGDMQTWKQLQDLIVAERSVCTLLLGKPHSVAKQFFRVEVVR